MTLLHLFRYFFFFLFASCFFRFYNCFFAFQLLLICLRCFVLRSSFFKRSQLLLARCNTCFILLQSGFRFFQPSFNLLQSRFAECKFILAFFLQTLHLRQNALQLCHRALSILAHIFRKALTGTHCRYRLIGCRLQSGQFYGSCGIDIIQISFPITEALIKRASKGPYILPAAFQQILRVLQCAASCIRRFYCFRQGRLAVLNLRRPLADG